MPRPRRGAADVYDGIAAPRALGLDAERIVPERALRGAEGVRLLPGVHIVLVESDAGAALQVRATLEPAVITLHTASAAR